MTNDENALADLEDDADDTSSKAELMSMAATLQVDNPEAVREVLAEALTHDLDTLDKEALFQTIKKRTGMGIGAIRKQFDAMSGASEKAVRADKTWPFAEFETADDPVPLEKIANKIAKVLRMRIYCTEEEITAVTLWCMGTYGIRPAERGGDRINEAPGPAIYPRLHVNSGSPGSGKTTLLETLSFIACRAVTADSISASAFFRIIDACQPTLLLDESDTWVNGNENIRKVINSGHKRSGSVVINAKDTEDEHADWEPTAYRTFAPVALAGLGGVAATIEDRSIKITLKKSPEFMGKRIRERDLIGLQHLVSPHLVAHGDRLAEAMAEGIDHDEMPDGLFNRTADNWEPLLAIAKLINNEWYEKALAACKSIATRSIAERPLTRAEQLLVDLYAYRRALVIFRWRNRREIRKHKEKGTTVRMSDPVPGWDDPATLIGTTGFTRWMATSDEHSSPWAEGSRFDVNSQKVIGGPTPHKIAKVLKDFGVRATRIDAWSTSAKKNQPVRGYSVKELRKLWKIHNCRERLD